MPAETPDATRGPGWALSVEPRVPGFRAGASEVPQLREAASLYETLPDTARPLGAGVLLCRVLLSHSREWDASGVFGRNVAPDVDVHVRTGTFAERRIPLAEDSYDGVFGVPIVDPVPTSVGVRLVDRDLAADDPVTRFDVAAPIALPLLQHDPLATLRCRLLPRAEALGPARAALAVADTHLLELEGRARPRRLDREPGAMDQELAAVRAAIRDAASYLGYADAEVHARTVRIDAVEHDVLARLAEAFDREASQTTEGPVAIGRDLEAEVRRIECEREGTTPARCTIAVEADYARIPDPPGFAPPLDVRLYPRGARPMVCMQGGTPGETPGFVRTAGRVTQTFVCAADDPSSMPAEPFLVRLASRGNAAFVRMRGADANVRNRSRDRPR